MIFLIFHLQTIDEFNMVAHSNQVSNKDKEDNKKDDNANSASLTKLSSVVSIVSLSVVFTRMFV